MTREWISSLVKAFLSPSMRMFVRCDTPQISYNIASPASKTAVPDWLDKFELMGRVVGKALFERIPLNLCFAGSLYKAILEESLGIEDIKGIDSGVLLAGVHNGRVDLQLASLYPRQQR